MGKMLALYVYTNISYYNTIIQLVHCSIFYMLSALNDPKQEQAHRALIEKHFKRGERALLTNHQAGGTSSIVAHW